MQVHKGLVAEITKRGTAIVFTYDGDIKEVELNGIPYKPGDEIIFYEHALKRERNHSRVIRYVSALAAGLLAFFSLPLSLMDLVDNNKTSSVNTAYAATVYIESKSSVKLGVNKANQVIGVVPLDRPAQLVLKGKDWRGENIETFMEEYFTTAKQTGYLGPEDKAIIAVDPIRKSEDTTETIQKGVQHSSFVKENNIQILTVTVPDVVVAKASIFGVTPGKFSIYLAARASGESIPFGMVKVASVTDLVNTIPTAAKSLSSLSECQLAQLVQKVFTSKTEMANIKRKTETSTGNNIASNKNVTPSKSADTQQQYKPENQIADRSFQDSTNTKQGNDEPKQVGSKQSEQQPDQKQQNQQPDQKQPDQKQPDQKQPDQKDQPQNDQPKDGQLKDQPKPNTPSGQQPQNLSGQQPQNSQPKQNDNAQGDKNNQGNQPTLTISLSLLNGTLDKIIDTRTNVLVVK